MRLIEAYPRLSLWLVPLGSMVIAGVVIFVLGGRPLWKHWPEIVVAGIAAQVIFRSARRPPNRGS